MVRVMTGVHINRQAIARMMRDVQREFDKHPIRVPVEADEGQLTGGRSPGSTVYNGPVIFGDANGAQLAWGNETVNQSQQHVEQIAPGFEVLAQAVVRTIEGLPRAGLTAEDEQAAEDAAKEVLDELTHPQPDSGRIRSGLAALKGILAPLAIGLTAGARDGAREWAKTAIEQLGTSF